MMTVLTSSCLSASLLLLLLLRLLLLLLLQDCRIADKLMTDFFPKSTLIKEVNAIMQIAEGQEWCDPSTDYSSVVKVLEGRAEQTLRVEGKEA